MLVAGNRESRLPPDIVQSSREVFYSPASPDRDSQFSRSSKRALLWTRTHAKSSLLKSLLPTDVVSSVGCRGDVGALYKRNTVKAIDPTDAFFA